MIAKTTRPTCTECILIKSRLHYHLRCLAEDATDPELSQLERLAVVRDRARRKGQWRPATGI